MRLLDYDPFTGISEYGEYDHQTKSLTVRRVQDVTPSLEANKARANNPEYSARGIKRELWHYAHIPIIIIEQWLNEGLNIYDKNHRKAIFAKLNLPDFKYLKTTTKRHAGRS